MSNGAKVAVIAGALGLTGLVAYWFRESMSEADDRERLRAWKARQASGPGVDLSQIQRVWLPWQATAFVKRQQQYPSFGSDISEVIRVLAITPAQLQKAGQKGSTIPAGFNPPPGMTLPTDEDVAAAGPGPVNTHPLVRPLVAVQTLAPDDDS